MEIEAVKQLLNKIDCQFIELFDPVDACMLEVLAWSADPSKIPKEFILDIPEPMQEWWMPPATDDPDMFELLVSQSPPAPPTEKKCLTFDLLLHLREVVDPVRQLPDSPSYDPFLDDREAPRRRTYNAFLGRIDGSGERGDGQQEIHTEPAERLRRHPAEQLLVAMEGEGDTGGVGGTVAASCAKSGRRVWANR